MPFGLSGSCQCAVAPRVGLGVRETTGTSVYLHCNPPFVNRERQENNEEEAPAAERFSGFGLEVLLGTCRGPPGGHIGGSAAEPAVTFS